MLRITCPKCKEIIEIGKDEYNSLLQDIETEEIERRVKDKVTDLEKVYKAKNEIEANKLKAAQEVLNAELNNKIKVLEEKLANSEKDTTIAVNSALDTYKETISKKNEEITKLKGQIANNEKELVLSTQKLKEQYEFQLEAKDNEIKLWKEFRMGDSTKDLGESLEKYCQDAFNEVRMTAYPDSYFEKDNKVDEEGKGDFIFRDYIDGIETVSIMFEMKTEKDTTKDKHKNEHFFSKLDKNRTSKGCEYAVLVSTLESDSTLYNKGIVDVSHRYPKMFVVRPQYFLTIIGLIRSMARNTLSYRKEIDRYKKENVDIANFETAVRTVVDKINTDYSNAGKIYDQVDKMCEDIIKKVQNFKDEFKKTVTHLGRAVNQIPNLEIKRLTANSPSLAEKFKEYMDQKMKEKEGNE